MNCVLITNGNFPSMLALAGWIKNHGESIRKVYVTYRLPSSQSNIKGLADLLINSGFSYSYFKLWVNKFAPFLLRTQGLPASIEEYINYLKLETPVETVKSVNNSDVVNDIKGLDADILISFSATQKFDSHLIESPKKGAINVHYGELPRYAGLSPYYWHLHNKEQAFGVTLHRIENRLDSGGIIDQVVVPIGTEKTCLGLLLSMTEQVSPILNSFFEKGASMDNVRQQDLSMRSYFRHPTRQNIADFHGMGFKMMDSFSTRRALKMVKELAK